MDAEQAAISNMANECHINTAALDGETNLKKFQSLAETTQFHDASSFKGAEFSISCEPPNRDLGSFVGMISIGKGAAPMRLNEKQVLLRGVTLANTYCATGIVVYTGHETKIMKNNDQDPPNKMSQLSHEINRQLYTLFILLAICCVGCALGAALWCSSNLDSSWYLMLTSSDSPDLDKNWYDTVNTGLIFVLSILSFNLQFSYMIPISLYVSMELSKFFTGSLIGWDLHMWNEELQKPAQCRNTNIIEELGQVDYVLSDKTGTLTRNQMELLKCSVNGVKYGTGSTEIEQVAAEDRGEALPEVNRPQFANEDANFPFYDPALNGMAYIGTPNGQAVQDFFMGLALCNATLPLVKEDGSIKYNANTPDDGALVKAAKNMGVTLKERTTVAKGVEEVVLSVATGPDAAEDHKYQIVATLDFTSARKRMSTVVKFPDGTVRVMMKGADNFIKERLKDQNSQIVKDSQQQADMFAEQGLRTLFVSQRVISTEDCDDWLQQLNDAGLLMGEEGEAAVEKAQALFEIEMELVGVTAIEDKLQANVGKTLRSLREADIKTWVLTGDKVGTAIEIGHACDLLTQDMEEHIILELNEATGDVHSPLEIVEMAEAVGEEAKAFKAAPIPGKEGHALIIEGNALFQLGIGKAEEDLDDNERQILPELQRRFIESCREMTAVMCCRVSPKQKASLTEAVRNTLGKITLGIGDGANDVGMIKAAHVGIGIEGVEGSQAVNASDFAITEFQHLGNLLLVHGRWTYRRMAISTCYFFYKSVSFCMTLVWYTFYSGYGGNYFYDTWLTTLWSPIFTFAPVIVFALFEQDLSYNMSMQNPELYAEGPAKLYLNTKTFTLWLGNAFLDSIIVFFFSFLCVGILYDGETINMEMIGVLIYANMLIVATLRIALQTQFFCWPIVLFYYLSVLLYFLYLDVECAVVAGIFTTLYWALYNLLGLYWFYLVVTLICTMAFLPPFAYKAWQMCFEPTVSYRVQQEMATKKDKKKKEALDRMERRATESDEARSKRRNTRARAIAIDGILEETGLAFKNFGEGTARGFKQLGSGLEGAMGVVSGLGSAKAEVDGSDVHVQINSSADAAKSSAMV